MSGTLRVAVLASTRGSDLDALLAPGDGYELALVVCNKECGALERARANGVASLLLPSQGKAREEYDAQLTAQLERHGIGLVVLVGYMRLLSPGFVARWRGRIMNIHPSLLPAFAGGMDEDVHAAVLARGCKVTGCTLHFVDEGTDTGPIVVQEAVPVRDDDTPGTLKERVQEAERHALREGVALFAQGRLRVEGSRVRVA